MTSFRQQMQELADKIALSRNERQQAVAQFPKMREQLRRQVTRLREDTRRELHMQASTQARELDSFNTRNKKSVGRLLRETRTTRLNRAQTMRAQLQRTIAKNRTEIKRSLQHHNTQRQRMQRSQSRQSLQAIQAIHLRVESLRSGTQRMTRNLAMDRMEARKIWASLRSGLRMRPSIERTLESATSTGRATVATLVPPLSSSSLGELTGLAMPPASLK